MRGTMVITAKWNALKLTLSTKIVSQNQYHISGRIMDISDTIKDLKDVGLVIPTTSPLNNAEDTYILKNNCGLS